MSLLTLWRIHAFLYVISMVFIDRNTQYSRANGVAMRTRSTRPIVMEQVPLYCLHNFPTIFFVHISVTNVNLHGSNRCCITRQSRTKKKKFCSNFGAAFREKLFTRNLHIRKCASVRECIIWETRKLSSINSSS